MWNVHERHNFESWGKCPIKQVHLQFCKHLLGVNRSAANLCILPSLRCAYILHIYFSGSSLVSIGIEN